MTDLRERVALACRILAMEGHGDLTLGHVSARIPGTDTFWIKGAGLGLDEVAAEDVVRADLDGRLLEGERPLHNEWVIHAEIYRARPDVACVIHTHPRHVASLGTTGEAPRLLLQESVLFWEGVAIFERPEVLTTPEQGRALCRCLGARPAVILRNHGLVAVGPSVPHAVVLAMAVEQTARAQLLTSPLGIAHTIAPEAAREMARAFEEAPHRLEGSWAYLVRRLERWEMPGGAR